MIRKSKNNENKPDFDVMFNEVQEEIQEKDAEQDIVSRVPEIKQLSTDIDKATTAVINAKLSLESSIRQTQCEEGVLGAAVNTISNKVDSINEHIDQVMEDAPKKLQVTVTVCDTDWQKMQKLHNQWMEQEKQMLADAESQTYGHCEEQRRYLAVTTSVLHRRFPFPPVNYYDCVGDCLLCVFPLDSIEIISVFCGPRHVITTRRGLVSIGL